jgi:hypothetical protein
VRVTRKVHCQFPVSSVFGLGAMTSTSSAQNTTVEFSRKSASHQRSVWHCFDRRVRPTSRRDVGGETLPTHSVMSTRKMSPKKVADEERKKDAVHQGQYGTVSAALRCECVTSEVQHRAHPIVVTDVPAKDVSRPADAPRSLTFFFFFLLTFLSPCLGRKGEGRRRQRVHVVQ